MPGYPTSCLSNAYMLLVPALRRMAHLPPHQMRTVRLPLAQRIVSTTGRHQFYTVRVADGQALVAVQAAGLKGDDVWEVPGDFTDSSGFEAGVELLRHARRPTAVFAANDAMAIGALSAFREAGVAVPPPKLEVTESGTASVVRPLVPAVSVMASVLPHRRSAAAGWGRAVPSLPVAARRAG